MTSFKATQKSKDNSFLEIDLTELFDGDVPDSSSFRQSVGQAIIDTIVNRTEDTDFISKAKGTYSKSYAESLEFKAFGKSKSNVNLTQSGDMLGSLNIIEETPTKIVIGWDDKENKAKGTNHNFGITVPKREFLGITSSEAGDIAADFEADIQRSSNDNVFGSSVDRLRDFVIGNSSISTASSEDVIFQTLFNGFGNGES